MYIAGGEEHLRLISTLPDADAGAPLPAVLGGDHEALLAYFGGLDVEGVHGPDAVVVVRSYAMYIGVPNEKAISGHPLASRGLEPFSFVEILKSGWIAEIERRNRVHPYHDPAIYEALRHFAFPFHDSTFECVAVDMSLEGIVNARTPHEALAGFLAT